MRQAQSTQITRNVNLGAQRVLFWMSPLTQLAPTQEPRFDLVSPPLLAALHADVQAVGAASGQPQYQLWLEPAPLRTVLVVDDNESLQRLFRRYLTGLPYAVLGAQSAAEGPATALDASTTSTIK
jgi:hypothetical protein